MASTNAQARRVESSPSPPIPAHSSRTDSSSSRVAITRRNSGREIGQVQVHVRDEFILFDCPRQARIVFFITETNRDERSGRGAGLMLSSVTDMMMKWLEQARGSSQTEGTDSSPYQADLSPQDCTKSNDGRSPLLINHVHLTACTFYQKLLCKIHLSLG